VIFIPVFNVAENCFGGQPEHISHWHQVKSIAVKSKAFFKKANKNENFFSLLVRTSINADISIC